MATPTKKMVWSDGDTATLLQLAVEREIFRKFDGKKLTTKQIFTDLAAQLLEKNISATPDQCKIKIKNLKKAYQERRRAMSRSGAGTLPDLPHQALLDELLGGRPSSLASDGNAGIDMTFGAHGHEDSHRERGDVWQDFDNITEEHPQQEVDQDDATTVEMDPAAKAATAANVTAIRQMMAGPSGEQSRRPSGRHPGPAPYQIPIRSRSISTSSSGSGSGFREPTHERSGESEASASQVIGGRRARTSGHGLSQAPRAVRRRNQPDPMERLIEELRESSRADAANVAALQAAEANMARNSDALVQQGAQQLALCTQMVQLLQQLVQRGPQGADRV